MNKFSFFLRRFHSLIALIPIAMFIVIHFCLNSTAFVGNDMYLAMVNMMKSVPGIVVLEVLLIAIPIIFHGIYGLYIVYLAKNNFNYKYYRNYAFYMQRISSIIMLAFIIWHVYTLRIAHHEAVAVMDALLAVLRNPLYLALYIISIVATAYHLTNGLFTFCITWGICIGDRAQKVCSILCIGLFALMSVWGTGIVLMLSLS